MSEVMKIINKRVELKGSILGTDELADIVDAIYDGWEELKDGFQVGDSLSLAGSLISAITGSDVALEEAFDLQDAEIVNLVNRSNEFELGNEAPKAKQTVKCFLVIIQTIDIWFHENK